jgi:hypothetical protein
VASLWARYGSLSAAALAFIGAAVEQNNSDLGAVLATIGIVLIGVWITLETHFQLTSHATPPEEEPQHDNDT